MATKKLINANVGSNVRFDVGKINYPYFAEKRYNGVIKQQIGNDYLIQVSGKGIFTIHKRNIVKVFKPKLPVSLNKRDWLFIVIMDLCAILLCVGIVLGISAFVKLLLRG